MIVYTVFVLQMYTSAFLKCYFYIIGVYGEFTEKVTKLIIGLCKNKKTNLKKPQTNQKATF